MYNSKRLELEGLQSSSKQQIAHLENKIKGNEKLLEKQQ